MALRRNSSILIIIITRRRRTRIRKTRNHNIMNSIFLDELCISFSSFDVDAMIRISNGSVVILS
jgi:hypothetical protein